MIVDIFIISINELSWWPATHHSKQRTKDIAISSSTTQRTGYVQEQYGHLGRDS